VFLFVCPVAAITMLPLWASGQRAVRNPQTGFEGVWNSATATPLERPRQFKDKPFFTAEEAAAWERQVAQNNEERPPQPGAKNTGTYNTFYREFGSRVVKTLRTSIITDPPDGRIPPLLPAAAEIKRRLPEKATVAISYPASKENRICKKAARRTASLRPS